MSGQTNKYQFLPGLSSVGIVTADDDEDHLPFRTYGMPDLKPGAKANPENEQGNCTKGTTWYVRGEKFTPAKRDVDPFWNAVASAILNPEKRLIRLYNAATKHMHDIPYDTPDFGRPEDEVHVRPISGDHLMKPIERYQNTHIPTTLYIDDISVYRDQQRRTKARNTNPNKQISR